jgi:hypothetical protein
VALVKHIAKNNFLSASFISIPGSSGH